MNLYTLLAWIGALVLVLDAAARVPASVAALLRACQPVLHATRELRTASTPVPRHRRRRPVSARRRATPTTGTRVTGASRPPLDESTATGTGQKRDG
ncbi:hypothetical protein [Nocardia asiatica]|uniref:hypothetical protein n=1 Tax=Nocardia asiatica TaxID=209252 RepID=UPI002456B831|nr:hypothetical protein [Nocardia asiatica]